MAHFFKKTSKEWCHAYAPSNVLLCCEHDSLSLGPILLFISVHYYRTPWDTLFLFAKIV